MRTRLTGSGTSAYTYTSENRLATGPGGAALAYDSTGRLSQVYTPALSTNFDYDGAALIGERDAVSYGLLRRYVHGPGEDQPLVWYEGAGLTDKRYLMTDERGSVVAVTNNTGVASGINSYDEYGIPASTNVGRFGYTGQTWIPEIGLNYYKARMYSPTLGRFMQTDPIGYKDGVNWYDYVDGDPVNRSDPTGLSCELFKSGYQCKVDNPGKLKGEALQKANDSYTRAVNRLMNNPDKSVKVTIGDGFGGIAKAKTTNGEIANVLINATVNYSSASSKNNAQFSGGTLTLFSNGLNQKGGESALGITFIHEGMHGTKMDSNMRNQFYKNGWFWEGRADTFKRFNEAHQVNKSPPGGGYRGAATRAFEDWDQ